jgi:hypothetical protein
MFGSEYPSASPEHTPRQRNNGFFHAHVGLVIMRVGWPIYLPMSLGRYRTSHEENRLTAQ